MNIEPKHSFQPSHYLCMEAIKQGHGLFTYFLLKGIKNEDVAMLDGSIRMADLFGHIKPQVERIARKQYNNAQTSQLIAPRRD